MNHIKALMKEKFKLKRYKSKEQRIAIKKILSKVDKKNFILNMASQSGKSLVYSLLGREISNLHTI